MFAPSPAFISIVRRARADDVFAQALLKDPHLVLDNLEEFGISNPDTLSEEERRYIAGQRCKTLEEFAGKYFIHECLLVW